MWNAPSLGLIAVLGEALSNVAKRVEVEAGDGRLTLTDDGIGIGDAHERGGLANMRRRAARLSGDCSADADRDGGAKVRWSVPI